MFVIPLHVRYLLLVLQTEWSIDFQNLRKLLIKTYDNNFAKESDLIVPHLVEPLDSVLLLGKVLVIVQDHLAC